MKKAITPSSARNKFRAGRQKAAASRRWNRDLLHRFPTMPTYGAIVDAIDLPMQNAATAAENEAEG